MLEKIIAIVHQAGDMIRDAHHIERDTREKTGAADLVTKYDVAVQEFLRRELLAICPEADFFGEEGQHEALTKDWTFIVDPIDGTTNFMHAMPHFAITVGLQRTAPDGSSEIVAGVTYNPVMNELFWAEKGKGCYLNDQRIRVAGRRDLSESLIATGLPFIGKSGHAQAIKDIHAVGQRVAGIRRLGSAALDFAWVAAGRYDAFYERGLKPWDVAAGILLGMDAGGLVTTIDIDGDPKNGKQIVAANPELQPQLRKVLQAA